MAVTGSSAIGGVVGRSYKNRTRFKLEETRIMAMRGGKKKKNDKAEQYVHLDTEVVERNNGKNQIQRF